LITRRPDGTLVVAAWNLFLPEQKGSPKNITIKLAGKSAADHAPQLALVQRLDSSHGSLLAAYEAMGRPAYPSTKQIEDLRRTAELPKPEERILHGDELKLTLPPQSLVLIEFPAGK
jgi:xylan 1,4-beta-xylosidase